MIFYFYRSRLDFALSRGYHQIRASVRTMTRITANRRGGKRERERVLRALTAAVVDTGSQVVSQLGNVTEYKREAG